MSVADELTKLKELLADGTLSQLEFEGQKKLLLSVNQSDFSANKDMPVTVNTKASGAGFRLKIVLVFLLMLVLPFIFDGYLSLISFVIGFIILTVMGVYAWITGISVRH
jgi:hypothetical protein